jgi:hypothetical protein
MKLYVGGINMVSAYMTIVATELRIAVTCQAPERSLLMSPQKKKKKKYYYYCFEPMLYYQRLLPFDN